ncbi:putative F-box/LRR protein [Quillaja saponaria]|uniref:F-box/LRR protein n=1 Tax=Quillaja saponaria TaxID=32244 RepID=A0AAD7KU84_QUISA|nr:putative F-box/LRR protein [Quillaja saponaria]KAJ7945041.1 putative F-box/LRR protein [Quillaja saponaria]
MEANSQLVRICIKAACESSESVEKWRRQKRSLERLPSHLADALLHGLLSRRLLYPSLLEVFKHSVEEVDARGESSVDAEWMAYLGAFRHLRCLNVADCHRVTSSAIWALTGMSSLKELDLSRCLKVNDAGIRHLLSISTMEKLLISETSVTTDGVKLLSSLGKLTFLDLGGLPVTDTALSCLQVLKKLWYLDLWGSKISNRGVAVLNMFPKLSYLNLAWTSVTKLPNLLSLKYLNMSNCTIDSVLEENGDKSPTERLILSGCSFIDGADPLLYVETNFLSFLDLSHTSIPTFCFLLNMKAVEYLDLTSCMIGDDSVELVAAIGENLKNLNLSSTRISSEGVGSLAGHVPKLEILSLSQTPIDEAAISYLSMMPSLKVIDLSNTEIKGFNQQQPLSLAALQNLNHLQRLNLEQTQVRDEALCPLSSFPQLSYLSLKRASLTDISLYYLSSIPKLTNLSVRDAVLTNYGLNLFKPPATLEFLDLRGCWLLTADAILSFCRSHPQIEVRHELSHVVPSGQIVSSRASQLQFTSRPIEAHKKIENISMSPCFIDQRLKYSRDELLSLQCTISPPKIVGDRGNATP